MSTHGMATVVETATMIAAGKVLLLAGDEKLLAQLPAGKWIGGTSANFMTAAGGKTDRERLFYTDISDRAAQAEVRTYSIEELRTIGKDYPANGFTVLIVPGLSEIHAAFAKEMHTYEGAFNGVLVGWISGVHVSEIGTLAPKAFAGQGAAQANRAAVMHVTLPKGFSAKLDIINLFTQDQGAVIEFDKEGFSTEGGCLIGGKPANLAAFITENKIDTKLPLVADFNSAMINVSIQAVDAVKGSVAFYAPVFKGIQYRFAKPVADYTRQFDQALGKIDTGSVAFSCNCILNYLYADLEGKKTGSFEGPITFGEIAYMLLNQTLVYMDVVKTD